MRAFAAKSLLCVAVMAGGAVASAAVAQEAALVETGAIPYPAAFFAEARPNNAFDMLQRLPGFSFDGGDNVRGFAGSAGNVLIDGQRPTSKAVSLEDQLKRIPAESVERIDLIRGGAQGIDMQGLPIVANVVRSRAASTTTAVTGGIKGFYSDGWVAPIAGVEWSRRDGRLTLEGSARAEWNLDDAAGRGARSRYFPNGSLRETGPYRTRERGPVLSANASGKLERDLDSFGLNAGISRTGDGGPEEVTRFDAAGRLLGQQLVREDRTETEAEIGADYERLLRGGLTGRLVGLQTLSWQDSDDRSQDPGGDERSLAHESTRESILRGTLTAVTSDALTLEGGAEGALNVLDARTTVTENGVGVPLPNANVRVEERRAEAFGLARWKPSDRLSVEAGSRFEVSRLTQSGDTESAVGFLFAKPRVLVAYAPDAASQVRLRVEREVGQLNFGDFVASADFGSGVVSAGGAELVPEKAWVFEAAFERRFWQRGAVVLTARHSEVQDVVDRIVVDGRFDAAGNIGDGARDWVELTATVPLDRLGVSGGLVSARGSWAWSKVTDPVTGGERRITRERPFGGEIRFSQDLARLRSTWGVDVNFGGVDIEYRIDEVRRNSSDTLWSAYWDWKPTPGLSIRAAVADAFSREFRRYRQRYAGPRSTAALSDYEVQVHRFDPYVSLVVRKTL
jgi:hypothetical protein